MMQAQRWRKGFTLDAKHTLFDPKAHTVAAIDDKEAKTFVERHHYSKSFPACRFRTGLFQKRASGCELVGVAAFSVPASQQVLPKYVGEAGNDIGVELGRFVLLDDVPFNAESWFIAQSFKTLRRARPEFRAVLAFSDPFPRISKGKTVMPGHIGTIYKATNAAYVGRSNAKTQLLDPWGREINNRQCTKLRRGERGGDRLRERLEMTTGLRMNAGESGSSFLARCRPHLTSRRHHGNHAYVWRFDKRMKLPMQPLAYPNRRASL